MQTNQPSPEFEELNADDLARECLQDTMREIAEENERMRKIFESDDAIKFAVAENKRLADHDAILIKRMDAMTGEINEHKRWSKHYQNRAEKAERKLNEYIKTNGILI